MAKRRYILVILISLAALLSGGCGKQGPLKLEPPQLPAAIKDISLRQVGDTLRISWRFPAMLTDGTTGMEPKLVSQVLVYHSETFNKKKRFDRQAEVIDKLSAGEIISDKAGMVTWETTFSGRKLDDRNHFFSVRYRYKRKKSPLSPVRAIHTALPLPPITDLRLEKEKKVIKLSWSKPKSTAKGRRTSPVLRGYNLYRKVNDGDFVRLNRTNLLQEYYEDTQTGQDGTYQYRVSSVQGKLIESELSNTASVEVKDIYAPDPPQGLICFKTSEGMKLIWEEAEETDVAGYNILRSGPESGEFQLIARGITLNTYLDKTVQEGKRYRYAVTALDRKGNESPVSNIVSESF